MGHTGNSVPLIKAQLSEIHLTILVACGKRQFFFQPFTPTRSLLHTA